MGPAGEGSEDGEEDGNERQGRERQGWGEAVEREGGAGDGVGSDGHFRKAWAEAGRAGRTGLPAGWASGRAVTHRGPGVAAKGCVSGRCGWL